MYASQDGKCLWGRSFYDPTTTGVHYEACSITDAPDNNGFRPFAIALQQTAIPSSSDSKQCSSLVALLGMVAVRAEVWQATFELQFACDATAAKPGEVSMSTAQHHVVASLNPAALPDWDAQTLAPTISLEYWSAGGVLYSLFHMADLAPWPADNVIHSFNGILSDIEAQNLTVGARPWLLSSIQQPYPVVAIISNIAVSSTGVVFFVAVRNTTILPRHYYPNITYDVALTALDTVLKKIIWQTPVVSS
jgi:hypothetical protein